jgi:hypothetical protein
MTTEGMYFVKRLLVTLISMLTLAFAGVAYAAGGPTPGPEAGPGCFGNWRAGSVQVIDQNGGNAGKDYFSQRKGDNSTINADNRATCDALTP